MLYPMKLIPAVKDYIWGGNTLKSEWGKESGGDIVAESWEVSCHPQGASVIANGEYAGKTLAEVVDRDLLGKNCDKFEFFPILVKLIDARSDLSIQVHPSDAYALKHEGQYGKTEMWYVIDAEEGAGVYCGFDRPYAAKEVRKALEDGKITDLLKFVSVKKGDVLFIEAGTVHAICGGLLICEVQQNSSLTYRLYDYGRVGADGKPRELHIDKAMKVVNTDKVVFPNETVTRLNPCVRQLAKCEYFTCCETVVDGSYTSRADSGSFRALTVIDGEGSIVYDNKQYPFDRGDTFFIPAGLGAFTVTGKATIISSYVDKSEK